MDDIREGKVRFLLRWGDVELATTDEFIHLFRHYYRVNRVTYPKNKNKNNWVFWRLGVGVYISSHTVYVWFQEEYNTYA